MLNILLTILDPSTFIGQFFQAIIEVIIWNQIFDGIKRYIKQNYSKSSWYLQGISKGDGEAEFLMLLIAIPQHTICASFVWMGYYFNSLQLFSMGTLGEFAFEFIEVYNIFMAIYVYNNCPFKPEMIKSLLYHHVPGIIVIIPTNVYFGNNHHVQQIVFSLLFVAPLVALFFMLHKTRNVYDLQQRGQFIFYFFLSIVSMSFARFYWTPLLMIRFFFDDFMDLSFSLQIMLAFYGVLITLFNCSFVLILCKRFYNWLYGDKCITLKNITLKNITLKNNDKEGLLAQPALCPMLKRCRSSPMYIVNDCNNKKRN